VEQDTGPQELTTEISKILLDACELAEIKPVKIKDEPCYNSKPWFDKDKDCQKLFTLCRTE